MRKLIAFALVMVLALSLLAGCSGGGSGSRTGGGAAPASSSDEADLEKAADIVKDVIDESDLENKDELKESLDLVLNTNWPADWIPDIVPPYPDGSCMAENEPGNIMIIIYETSAESRDKYIETLIGEGWAITVEQEGDNSLVTYTASKEGVEVSFALMLVTTDKIYMSVKWEL